jgi:hypothetical protein
MAESAVRGDGAELVEGGISAAREARSSSEMGPRIGGRSPTGLDAFGESPSIAYLSLITTLAVASFLKMLGRGA